MESKHMTLRSQTVQCPHCGEYYSVTYKYCPFCDAGRKAEARKKAARKQQAASLFTGLFSSREDEGMDVPVRESGREQSRRQRERQSEYDNPGESRSRRSASEYDYPGESRSRQRPVQYDTPIPRSESFRKKKTSEMTEEEKKAYRAEREARAAARKRERDRAARAAALTDLEAPAVDIPAVETPPASTHVITPSGMETVEITIDPMNAAPAEIVAAVVSPGTAIMSSPTEHTQVIASSLSSVRAPERAASIMPTSSLTGINAPDRPPTWEDAMIPPFFTASLSMASAAVEP